jgi:organic hydroperoxide reductase OsmC/OhrA
MPSEHHFHSQVRWTGALVAGAKGGRSITRDCVVTSADKPAIAGSASAAFFGDDARYNPEELLLGSLAQCHLLTYVALAARDGLRLRTLSVRASGTLAMLEGKMRFRSAQLELTCELEQSADIERAQQLNEPAHRGCFMANSVNFPVEISAHVTAAPQVQDS